MVERIWTNLDVDGHDFGSVVAEEIKADEVGHLDFFVQNTHSEGLFGGVGAGIGWGRHSDGVC